MQLLAIRALEQLDAKERCPRCTLSLTMGPHTSISRFPSLVQPGRL
jgi:hypothetical protein